MPDTGLELAERFGAQGHRYGAFIAHRLVPGTLPEQRERVIRFSVSGKGFYISNDLTAGDALHLAQALTALANTLLTDGEDARPTKSLHPRTEVDRNRVPAGLAA